jgi:probable phosphoglycerate mutase
MMIYLIRHGETDWNHQRRRQGRRDIPLNDQGRVQMHACGELLSGLPADLIVTSPLSRAVNSAEIIAEHLGAIQVLGYLLGALAGFILVFI